jgi:AraC family transcriptional regulator, positive regulator of tynA and feaB
MGFSSFCVGSRRSGVEGARDFQARFNETFQTRLRVDPKDGILVVKTIAYSSSRLRLAHLRASSYTMSLMPGQPASAGMKQFVATFQTQGASIVRQDGREARAIPGDVFVLDACKPFQIETTVASLQSVFIPSDVLREAIPGVDSCTALALPTRSGAGRIARVTFEELFDPASEPDEDGLSRIASTLPHALAMAFAPHLSSLPSMGRDDHHRERIKDFVRRNLRDPRLSTSSIAKGVGLSLRRLHELFAAEPETLMRWTRTERLKRISDELVDPALVERPIANIAYDWGFRQPSHFSRSFRTEYGVSPRIVRARVRLAQPEHSRHRIARPWLSDRLPRNVGEGPARNGSGMSRLHECTAQQCDEARRSQYAFEGETGMRALQQRS